MKTDAEILQEFCDMAANRCAFDLKDGTHYEGYTFEVDNDTLVFGEGGPLAPEEDLLIPVSNIDLNTLSYYDESTRWYLDARWDEEQGMWELRPSPPPPPIPPTLRPRRSPFGRQHG